MTTLESTIANSDAVDKFLDAEDAADTALATTDQPTPVTAIVIQPVDQTPLYTLRQAMELMIAGIEPDTDPELVKEIYTFVEGVKKFAKESDEALKTRMIPVVKAAGNFTIGPTHFWIGYSKPDPKPVSYTAVREALMKKYKKVDTDTGEEVVDWSMFDTCLASGAFKPAATIEALGPENAELFEYPKPAEKLENDAPKQKRSLKSDAPKLQSMNIDFVKPK